MVGGVTADFCHRVQLSRCLICRGETQGKGTDEKKGWYFIYPRAKRRGQRSCECWSGFSVLLLLVLFGDKLQGPARVAISLRHMCGEDKTMPLAGTT